MFVEQVLTERLGDVGKKLHTARSRNDQVALDLRMYLRDADRRDYRAGKGRCLRRMQSRRRKYKGGHHARLYPFAAGAAHHLWPPPDGLRHDAPARPRPSGRLPQAHEPSVPSAAAPWPGRPIPPTGAMEAAAARASTASARNSHRRRVRPGLLRGAAQRRCPS